MKFHPIVTKLWIRTEKSSKFRQSKDNNSSITNATLMKVHVQNHTMVIYIQYKVQFKVHEFQLLFTMLWLRTEKINGI